MERIQTERVRVTSRDAKIFIFGDSLSDTGNIFAATGNLFPPSPPYFNGRLSNGPLAVEVLADRLGLTLNLLTNFAIGGAKTGRENIGDIGLIKFGGLLDQIDRFSQRLGSQRANPKALYLVWAGGNDLLNLSTDLDTAVTQAVENITTTVTRLAELGAKNIVVVQNPNFGRTPLSLQAGQLETLTQATREFNAELRSTLSALERRSENLDIILTNLFSLGEEIAQNPVRFGLSNVVDSYLQGLVPRDPTLDPNRFFFWDQVHPTGRIHDLFATALRQNIISQITDSIDRLGTLRDDVLVGFSGDDLLTGRAGQDRLIGNQGDDSLRGGRGDDVLQGNPGDDSLLGGLGDDLLLGGAGHDRLFGQAGQDSLSGGSGIDFLSGGAGDDLLNGGGNCDLFSLRANGSTDTIQDFETGNDLIFLAGSLSFDQLDIRQQGRNTVIAITDAEQPLAILENVRANAIGSSDFLGERTDRTLLSLANREQGAAILDAIQAESSGVNNLL